MKKEIKLSLGRRNASKPQHLSANLVTIKTLSSKNLESTLSSYVISDEKSEEELFFLQNGCESFISEDGLILNCIEDEPFAPEENGEFLKEESQQDNSIFGFKKDELVKVAVYDSQIQLDNFVNESIRSNWNRFQSSPLHEKNSTGNESEMRVHICKINNEHFFSADKNETTSILFHLLRSLLTSHTFPQDPLHISSPWHGVSEPQQNEEEFQVANSHYRNKSIYTLLVPDTTKNIEFLTTLAEFRVGDANPCFYLYSISRVSKDSQVFLGINEYKTDFILFVYKNIPPRNQFFRSTTTAKDGCLYELISTSNAEAQEEEDQEEPAFTLRKVSPPYLSFDIEYSHLLTLFHSEILYNISRIVKEANSISSFWKEWPEKSHYTNPNSWTVFPLCHTFPAHDITKRVWIPTTTALVPFTTEVLQNVFGWYLRTALFSRLQPGTRLEPHSGWADLANFVMRCHLPLVGSFEEEECGLWVDGCLLSHKFGQVQCFDDSKVHRAFNYSQEERIVLIFDLIRPRNLPFGTANGGHTEELDEFIKEVI